MCRIGYILIFIITLTTACDSNIHHSDTLFTNLPASHTGIDFVNELTYSKEFNIYTYRNFYNGGGVALADVNNDGLLDIYFCGNMKTGRLYINKGDFQFEDVTEASGLMREGVWVTGASFADINGDGQVDLYLCKSGKPSGENRYNELFINQGIEKNDNGVSYPTFSEEAHEYGIADMGFSTHAAFFDYDKDGDLDCYLLNNSFRPIGSFDLRKNQRYERDSLGGNKLYRNEGNHFVDVSEEAGIYGSIIGFGLGVSVADINRDGWQDIYVSNDFFERDYLYLNNQDGTFSESLEQQIQELSGASMGADIADISNDGYPEIFVTDMLPRDDARMKTKTTFENWDKYQANVKNGYYRQFTRNVLQLNRGPAPYKVSSSYHNRLYPEKDLNQPQGVIFSEIGRLAGTFATDWSWGALIMDLDNDGWKDIFVANGIVQDLTDQDYINFIADPRTVRKIITKDSVNFKQLIDVIPSNPLPNYAFQNQAGTTGFPLFEDKAAEWGLGTPSFSNGSAYGDLDNDGDLDLVINNTNMPPFVYRNETEHLYPDHHYLKFHLIGEGTNTFALGTQITLIHDGEKYFQEQMPMRGFESTMDFRPNFGLGNIENVDTVKVDWPDGRITLMMNVPTNQTLTLDQKDAKAASQSVTKIGFTEGQQLFRDITSEVEIEYEHRENSFTDFDRDRLIYHMLSNEGPKMCKADVNKDGREDIYIGGAKDSPGTLFIQLENGKFRSTNKELFEQDKLSEDMDCEFFDADGDGDPDLYVASGGNEYPTSSSALIDRLYINDGRGRFTKSNQILPAGKFESSSCIHPADYDKDGDMDLFVGIRLRPFFYGFPVNGYILENDGSGMFTNVTPKVAPDLEEIGMITDVRWEDYDQDEDVDLMISGEWMPVTVLKNEGGKFINATAASGLHVAQGFWTCLMPGDFNEDGWTDFIVGNHGLNTRFKSDTAKPVSMFINDFDGNGRAEQILTVYNGEASYPLALRHDLIQQLPVLKKKYLKYENYKEQTIADMFSEEQLEGARVLKVNETRTSVLLSQGNGRYEIQPLPIEAQLAPMYGILVHDYNGDGHQDVLMGGNFHRSKPEVGIYAADHGVYLTGDGKGGFTTIPLQESGFWVEGEIRDIMMLDLDSKPTIWVARNNDSVQVFEWEE